MANVFSPFNVILISNGREALMTNLNAYMDITNSKALICGFVYE